MGIVKKRKKRMLGAKPTAIRIPEAVKNELMTAAYVRKCTVSDLVRYRINQFFAGKANIPPGAGPSVQISVHLDEETRAKILASANDIGTDPATLVAALLESWKLSAVSARDVA